MLGRHVFVLELLGFLERAFQNLVHGGRDVHPRGLPADFRDGGQLAFRFGDERIGLDTALFQHGTHNAFTLRRERDEEMQRVQRLVTVLLGDFLRLLDGFLCLLRQFVESECHYLTPWVNC